MTEGQTSLTPIFVNKVLSEHGHTHSFTYCLWQLSHYNTVD